MAGHSKWANIRHKKGKEDIRRGKIFTKLAKEIMVAARIGGGDPASNPRLRTATIAARGENMPKDNIERAIKKGIGDLDGANYEEITYEGYGPSGAAVIVEVMTDNKNRTVGEVRHAFSKCGGNLGANGCVAWMFDKKGLMVVDKGAVEEESLMEAALDAGAEDIREEEDCFEIITGPQDFETVRDALEATGFAFSMAEVCMIPQTMTRLEGKDAQQMVKLMEMLEDNDDVQKVHTNADIPEDFE
ncbi:YebC/PmpR family DNA-binding transcriptional regulator [Desulfobotulus sp. H1]|uniref:Probable transcriptional regulatory protein OOT00_13185 n=1 Tax=Desulfobotulus pelophilus TaxID=2823377 RepID=A0ABT3NBU7_9BACT|nr:YebC/PmpR family DNA-binding transcriptional regulator [Desulfobotulus pelophilus]MCW7754939.1 YebC/PmpR family DNA-binding transcriptional regulator [Desulfobotulus pelophilus]